MKIAVKKTEWLQLQCAESNSSLINKIYIDFFHHSISDTDIKIEYDETNQCLIEYKDISFHGSPMWQKRNVITDKEKIKLHDKLKDIYFLLLKQEKQQRN